MFVCFSHQITTLSVLNIETQGDTLNEDDLFSARQTVKHTCVALKRYFEMHLAIKVDSIKRSYSRDQGVTPPDPIPKYKVSMGHFIE